MSIARRIRRSSLLSTRRRQPVSGGDCAKMTLDKIGQMVLSPVSLNHAKVWLGSAMAPRNIVRPDQHFPTCARTAAYSRLRLKESHALTYCEAAASPMLRIEVDQCVVFGFPHTQLQGCCPPLRAGWETQMEHIFSAAPNVCVRTITRPTCVLQCCYITRWLQER